jgi:CRP-like cAMP-binding protein
MQSLAGRNHHADLLESIPALQAADRRVLEDFLTHSAVTVHCGAGKTLNARTDRDRNLYLVVSGSAELRTEDGVAVTLSVGDYFGGDQSHRSPAVAAVVAVTDVEVLVMDPSHIVQLTASRNQRRVKHGWIPNSISVGSAGRHRRHRHSELVSLGH